MNNTKLGPSEKHLLRLAQLGADAEGWSTVSKQVWPLLASVPEELLEREFPDGAEKGRCRLTPEGQTVLAYL